MTKGFTIELYLSVAVHNSMEKMNKELSSTSIHIYISYILCMSRMAYPQLHANIILCFTINFCEKIL